MKLGRNLSKGFTLIELVIVIIILAILVAIAVPRFVDLGAQAKASAASASESAARSALALYVGENSGSYPTVTTLAGYLTSQGTATTAVAGGIQLAISGTTYTIATYSDDACSTATIAVGNTVKCIGVAAAA